MALLWWLRLFLGGIVALQLHAYLTRRCLLREGVIVANVILIELGRGPRREPISDRVIHRGPAKG